MLTVFSLPFMQIALLSSLIIGGICACLGVQVVLRRIVFVGAALAQVSSAGVGLAIYLGMNPSMTSLILTLAGVGIFSIKSKGRSATRESFIGAGYAAASALAVLFVAKSAQGEAHLLDVFSGNILTVTPEQLWWAAGVSAIAVILLVLFYKQLLFSAFDAETARASGINVAGWDLLFFLILGVIISIGIRLAGTLLTFAYLVVPAVTALRLSQHLGRIYAIAVAAATISTIGGLYASFTLDLPSGPTIVAVSCLLLGFAWVVSKFKQIY